MGDRTCTAPGCSKPHDSHGLCKAHVYRARKAGALPTRQLHGPRGEGAWDRLYRIGWDVTPTGCWEWRGGRNNGYGVITVAGRARRAHRISYEVHAGPVPDGLVVMHKCDNPPCVNPDHLHLGTQADNLADMLSKGRGCTHGLALGRSKGRGGSAPRLTAEDVREIRQRCASGEPQSALAEEFRVTRGYVNNLVHRRARASVN